MTTSKLAAFGAVASFVAKKLEPNEKLGGTVIIKYGDADNWAVGAPLDHVKFAVERLRGMNRQSKRHTMRNVMKSIEKLLPLAKAETATHQQAMFLAQDITIWYANEVLEGRAKIEDLEEFKG